MMSSPRLSLRAPRSANDSCCNQGYAPMTALPCASYQRLALFKTFSGFSAFPTANPATSIAANWLGPIVMLWQSTSRFANGRDRRPDITRWSHRKHCDQACESMKKMKKMKYTYHTYT